jgi:hypothetical protein
MQTLLTLVLVTSHAGRTLRLHSRSLQTRLRQQLATLPQANPPTRRPFRLALILSHYPVLRRFIHARAVHAVGPKRKIASEL